MSKSNLLKKSLIILFCFLLLFIPLKPAKALFGITEDIWGWLEMALDALDMFDTTMMRFLWQLILLLLGSLATLFIGTSIFDWAIKIPPMLGATDPTINPMVWAGWNFCRGLVNIFLILILVAIALAYILKIELFAVKKALPKLIIVALLTNFSLLFVGIAVDLTQIVINGLINSLGTGLASLVGSSVWPVLLSLLAFYVVFFTAYFIVALIPFANVAYILATLIFFVAALFFGFLILTFVMIIFGFALGILFITLSIMFMMRVGIIWVLAILSPLALLCWILPQTKKYWDTWLKLLVEWLVWGIIAVLFTGLGLKLVGFLPQMPGTITISIFGINFDIFPAALSQYLFLLVYLGITYYFTTKEFAPAMAGFLMGAATGIVAMGAPMVAAPLKTGYERFMTEQRRKEEEFKAKAEKGEKLTRREQFRKYAGWAVAAPGRFAYRMMEKVPEVEFGKEIDREVEAMKRRYGTNVDKAVEENKVRMVRGRMIGPAKEKLAALALYAQEVKGAEGAKKLTEEQAREAVLGLIDYRPEKLKDFVKQRQELIRDEKIGDLITRKLVPKGIEDEDIKTMAQRREKIIIEGREMEIARLLTHIERYGTEHELTRKPYEELMKRTAEFKLQQALKRDDADKYPREAVVKPEFLEGLARYGNREFTRRLLETGKLDWKELKEAVEKVGVREVAKTNPYILKFPESPPGRLIGAESFAPREEINRLISEVRRERLARKDVDELVERVIAAVRRMPPPTTMPAGRGGPPTPPAGRGGPPTPPAGRT